MDSIFRHDKFRVVEIDNGYALGLQSSLNEHFVYWSFNYIFQLANSKPIELVPLNILRELDKDIFFAETGQKPTIRNLAQQFSRAMSTDVNCPVTFITEIGLVDGYHRVLKAVLVGKEYIPAHNISISELELNKAFNLNAA